MKNLLLVLLLSFVAQAQAQNRVKEVNVCGDFNVSSDGRHFLKVNSGDLQIGLYEIFATNQHIAELLSSMKSPAKYCMKGGFDKSRPRDGISLIAIQ